MTLVPSLVGPWLGILFQHIVPTEEPGDDVVKTRVRDYFLVARTPAARAVSKRPVWSLIAGRRLSITRSPERETVRELFP